MATIEEHAILPKKGTLKRESDGEPVSGGVTVEDHPLLALCWCMRPIRKEWGADWRYVSEDQP